MKTLILTLAAILTIGISHAAPKPAVMNADTTAIEINSWDLAAQDQEMSIEAWMFDCNYWQNCVYQEEPIEFEDWMFESFYLDKERKLEMEEWMFLPLPR